MRKKCVGENWYKCDDVIKQVRMCGENERRNKAIKTWEIERERKKLGQLRKASINCDRTGSE